MKKHLEFIYDYEKNKHSLLYSILFYTLCLIIHLQYYNLKSYSSILINPFIFFGIPYYILNHLRYKELKETYKNYTLSEFILVAHKIQAFICLKEVEVQRNNYLNENTTLKLRPLAINMLSINHDSLIYDLEYCLEKKNNIDIFITEQYFNKFKPSNFINQSFTFYVVLTYCIFLQCLFWNII